MIKRRLLLMLLLLFAAGGSAQAHEIRPIFLGIAEQADGRIDLRLKVPVFRSGDVAAVQVHFGAACDAIGQARNETRDDSLLQSWSLHCAGGLAGQRLQLQGFGGLVPDGLVSVQYADGRQASYAVNRDHADLLLQTQDETRPLRSLAAYVPIGIEHVLSGLDHLLFVLCLMLLVAARGGTRRAQLQTLLATISAFTLAHSLTLALAVIGGVSLPTASVETLIALSILLLAVELARAARTPETRPATLAFREPWLMAFVFGLLHGFGFAGALLETGLPAAARGWALLLFNLGVEAGQLIFVAAALLAITILRALPTPQHLRRTLVALPVTAIGSVAAAWVLQRGWMIFGG
ncbi:HupE/UreJ family protein [Hydrocarboniphaga sp.]|uniref:HupE/UreJ family protein n=1 Tax=Hydrocarboniphaga sp. TaxID=2033016 RepID=UPI003D0E63BA